MDNIFGKSIIPDNEEERLAKLRSLNIIDMYEENGTFKHIAVIASRMFNVPIALVNFVDKDFVFSGAYTGLNERPLMSRGDSLCSVAILKTDVTVFEDASKAPCLLTNPLVVGDFRFRFYAAAPLVTSDGFTIGAVCVMDKVPRKFSESDKKMLEGLARIVMEEVEQ